LCTLVTGTAFHPALADATYFGHFAALVEEPALLLTGLGYALPLLAALLAHEWGHMVAARKWGVDASLPYFIPGPPIVTLGTFGAFIRLRSPIPSRRALLQIGVWGPFAGFAVSLTAVTAGFLLLRLGYRVPADFFGANVRLPLAFWLLRGLFTGSWTGQMVYFENPVLAAAWLGLFFQGLNLLPIGQLDGGHAVYSISRRTHGWVGRILVAAMAISVLWEPQWALWVVILLVLGLRHPPCMDEAEPLRPQDRLTAIAAFAIFLLCFHPAPFDL
jgi:membrane-associated protease RseP (regulator of RpoE activity)